MKSIKPKSSGLAAFLVAAAIGFSMPVDASCIVSGDTSRDSAVSIPYVLDRWFESGTFFIAIKPLQRAFSSYPPGLLISLH